MKSIIYIAIVVFNSICFSQTNSMSIPQEVKDSLIKNALESVNREIDTSFYEVSVKQDKTGNYTVQFYMSIVFIPLNTSAIYGFWMSNETTGYDNRSNYENETSNTKEKFYLPSKKDLKKKQFVLDAMKTYFKVDDKEINSWSFTIEEKRKYYQITVGSRHQTSGYKIKKGTGELYDEYHEHNVVPIPLNDEE